MKSKTEQQPGDADTAFEQIDFSDRSPDAVCPKCDSRLTIANLGNAKVAACKKCLGILLQTDLLALLVRNLRAEYAGEVTPRPLDPSQLETTRTCPSCMQEFETHPYYGPGNVVIDSCCHCHLIWLDRGELTTVVKAPGK